MSTLADIVHNYGAAYLDQYGKRMLPSHRRTLRDISRCRTAALGGHVYRCDACGEKHYQYHSCQNRHCPQCQHDQGQRWLVKQQECLVPVPYFMVTFTLPEALRDLVRRNQWAGYNILFRASAAALQDLAWDPRYVGGQIGMVGVLHTWGRNLSYHPHVHYLVPAGGLSADGEQWISIRRNFLVPVRALSIFFRAKFRDALKETDWFAQIPTQVWTQDWVLHCQPVGNGLSALKYLAPYIFRVAISNRRILKVADGKVTFRYRESDTKKWRTSTLSAEEFLRRFLQHVLPKGFVKVRYYGLFSPSLRHWLTMIRLWLDVSNPKGSNTNTSKDGTNTTDPQRQVLCPTCGQVMRRVKKLRPRPRCPP